MSHDTHGAWWWRNHIKTLEQDIEDIDTQRWQLLLQRRAKRKELNAAYEASQAAGRVVPFIPEDEPDELDALEGGNVVPFVRQ
jgi:hypothetical protein